MADAPIPIQRARSARGRTAADLVVHNIGTLVTPAGAEPPLRGETLGKVLETRGAAVAVKNGMVAAVGPELTVRSEIEIDGATHLLDARGMMVIPGFVDCHAHPLFAGTRAAEFEARNAGADYEEILASGGGIGSTINSTDSAPDDELAAQIEEHFDWMLRAGTTTAEAKSGYAGGLKEELRLLRMGAAVAETHPLDVSATALVAHALPPGWDGDTDDWVAQVALPAIEQIAADDLALQVDVFLERGAFSAAQARTVLAAAEEAGLGLRIHGDQFSEAGAIPLAVELGARSVDHLESTGADGIARLAASSVAGVLLPLSSLFLGRPWAPGRALVDAGAVVALASDFNPGSSFGESLPLAMHLAAVGCGLTAAEAFSAATINAAWVIGHHRVAGRIARGYRADLVICDQPDLRHLAYHAGSPAIAGVVKAGAPVLGIDAPPEDEEPPPEAAF